MHKTLLCVAVLLCACSAKPQPIFSHGFSDRAREVMVECARIIAKAPFVLTEAEANWHYQRCLVQNNATI